MSTPDNPDPAALAPDDDDAAIDEALAALTSGVPLTATADEDEELGEDTIGEADEDFDEDEDDDGTDDAADDMIGALEVPLAADAPINFAEPGAETEEAMSTMPIAIPEPALMSDEDRRLRRLEQLATALIDAENTREGQRVKRKVKASATGAAGAGLVPVVLMLTGAFNLDPELAATLSAGVAALASFLTGYLTPERRPALDPVVAHKVKKPRTARR
ncbi:MAG TPA: hypothetical protein VFM58_12460 [Solirubrobacteraceae bacterium]|nr:hypothetical protein [Solirubrobacteraceae bacterium]